MTRNRHPIKQLRHVVYAVFMSGWSMLQIAKFFGVPEEKVAELIRQRMNGVR